MEITLLGQQYNVGEKPTVILYRDTRKYTYYIPVQYIHTYYILYCLPRDQSRDWVVYLMVNLALLTIIITVQTTRKSRPVKKR